MLKKLKGIDGFTRNIIIVFAGTSLVNFLNLLYQLLIAHKLSPPDFAAFNSLLSLLVLLCAPLGTIQLAIAKYSAAFNAHNQISKIKFLLSAALKKISVLAIFTLLVSWPAFIFLANKLRIEPSSYSYILALFLFFTWFSPFFLGTLQGLGLFGWFTSATVVSAGLKLLLAYIFIRLGYSIAGALGALLISVLIGIAISYFPLKKFFQIGAEKEDVGFKEIIIFLLPVAATNFCFMALVSFDMVLVKYYFSSDASGVYSLAQMVGKIFLFLPGAISIVMFPKVSSLNAKNLDTRATLRRSLAYVFVLCAIAALSYNFFPSLSLRILTGKAYPESIYLGRMFSLSMSFFTLLYILISYFLSIKDLRYIKYLAISTLLQVAGILVFHHSLFQVQLILCINSAAIFFSLLFLLQKPKVA